MAQQVRRLDRYGRELSDDDNTIPDGGRIKVALPFMDDLSEAMRRALGLDGGTDMQGFITGHRPGFAVTAAKDESARGEYIRRLNDAWKQEVKAPEVKAPPPASQRNTSNNNDGEAAYQRYVQRISYAWR
jgi:hypothetical protein